jgi:DNA polymerase elongation subunit (family B)
MPCSIPSSPDRLRRADSGSNIRRRTRVRRRSGSSRTCRFLHWRFSVRFVLLHIVPLDRADIAPAKSRHQLLPDPEKDELTAVFFCFQNEDDGLPDTTTHRGYHAGYVVIDSPQTQGGRARLEGVPCHVVDSELDLINWVIDFVKTWDPDVLAGWELHNASWGYLTARASEAFSEYTVLPTHRM